MGANKLNTKVRQDSQTDAGDWECNQTQHVMAGAALQPCLLGVGYRVSSVTTRSWKREFISRSATVLGKDTLLPASGSSKQPYPSTFSPDSEVPAFVIAATGLILQDTFRLLQVGPNVQAVPTAPAVELSCCNRLHMRRWQLIHEATY